MNPDQPADQNKTQNPPIVSATTHGTEGGSIGVSEQGPRVENFAQPSGAELEPRIDSKLGANVVVSPQFRHDQGPISPIPPSHVALPNDPETLRASLPQAKRNASGKVDSGKTWIGKLTQFVAGKLLMRQPA